MKLLDHSLLEFRTDPSGNIADHLNSVERIDGDTFYVISMGVWRSCDSSDPRQKYKPAKLVLELLSGSVKEVQSSGGPFILNLNLKLWTIPVLLVVFVTFGILLWKIPGIKDIFTVPQRANSNSNKID